MTYGKDVYDIDDELDIIVVGASGNLAREKIFPALFALFSQGLLPEKVRFTGFARSELSLSEFRSRIMERLTCRYTPEHSCESYIERFLKRCYYCCGEYNSADSFLDLYTMLQGLQGGNANRLFYLAVPPSIFTGAVKALGDAGLVHCGDLSPWSRVVIEKPFGRDRASSDSLNRELLNVFTEKQTYRIDHYLGKEMVQDILVLRFANQIFKPLWNSQYIRCVEIIWQENIGTDGRGGYFDNYGIIRDVIQNHLLQILALIAMDEPVSLSADDVRNSKVRVLRNIPAVKLEDVALGQYTSAEKNGHTIPGYRDDPTVPDDSITPTFAKVRLAVNTENWTGVPFVIRAGKAMNRKCTEVRIVFKAPESNIFCKLNECPPPNELIIRIQPDEGVHFKIVNKAPGLKMAFHSKELDLSYKSAFAGEIIPEAYESLLLDVIHGEKSLFIRDDELRAAWDIFTSVLHKIESRKIMPDLYPFGSDCAMIRQQRKDCGCENT